MCGIFGITSYGIEEAQRQTQETAIRIIGTEILQLLEDRGGDATGVAALFEDCNYMGLKKGVAATEFLSMFGSKKEDYEGWLDIMRKKESPTKMFIGHCRKSSVGNSIDNLNNHPIHINNQMIGVHNGTLKNHEAIFHNLECKRDGNVDSEAIFRLLYHFLNEGKDPFTEAAIQETCKRLHGTYSVIAMNAINPNQIAVFRDGRPLAFALIKKLNLLVIASEEKYIKHAVFKYNRLSTLYKLENDFTRLTKKDLSFGTLLDDSLAIFDNRVEITDDIEMKDLISSVKIPRTNKVWANKIIAKEENEEETIDDKTKNDVNADNVNDDKDDEDDFYEYGTGCSRFIDTRKSNISDKTCMLWSKKFDKLTLEIDDSNVEKLFGIEIDTVNNEVYKIQNLTKTLLPEYSIMTEGIAHDIVDALLIEGPKEESVKLVESTEKEVLAGSGETNIYVNGKIYTSKIETTITEADKASSIEIDVSKNAKALELSEITSKYDMKRYSDDEEAMEAIDILDKSIVKAMPFYSLCNRIKRFAFKDGFYNGYTTRMKEEDTKEDTKENLTRLKSKQHKAEKKIRVLKTLSKVLSKVLYSCTKYNIFDIQSDLKDIIRDKQEIDSITLKSVYSKEDLKDFSAINKVTTLLELNKINGER